MLRSWGRLTPSSQTGEQTRNIRGETPPLSTPSSPRLLQPEAQSLDYVKIAAGENHLLAINSIGEIFAAGRGCDGQLGTGLSQGHEDLRIVQGLSDYIVTDCACGANHSLAITASKKVPWVTIAFNSHSVTLYR